MKRSEAIKAIARSMMLPTISSTPSGYWMKYAEIALNTMEQCGMAPPPINGVVESEELEDGSLVVHLWKWEPEDETKEDK